jgi:hypothetical protein
MANQFLNTNWVSMKILRLLVNMLEVTEYFNRDWERDFNKEFAPGSQISVKFPQRMTVADGMGYAPQAINRLSTPVNLDQWLQIAFEWDDYEAAVHLERSEAELTENYFQPAAEAMAQDWDSRSAKFAYQNASNVVGALGTDPTSVSTYYQARQRLIEKACPPGQRGLLISSSMMATLGTNIVNIFHPDDELTRMFKKGSLGTLAGFSAFESNSLYSHTAGTWAGTFSVTGANQSGASLIITGTNAGDTMNVGDKFSIANTNAANPMTRRIAGKATAQQFTITQNYVATGGADTITMLPAIYGPGSQYQNVDALPANGAALTLWPGTTTPSAKVGTVGLALSKFAFAFVGAKLYVPQAVEKSGFAFDSRTQIGVRKVKAWDPVRSMQINRMDSLGGFGNLYQDNGAVCVVGA